MKKLLFLTALSVSTLSLTACIVGDGYYDDGYRDHIARYDRHYDRRDSEPRWHKDERRDHRRLERSPERRAAEARRRANDQLHKGERRPDREERRRRDIFDRRDR
ncbi:hypothetical protein CBG46_08850 [Actinobacillus succinogenes]|uniref:Lipoprotein n=1 Tax=Actinobacillus succinogenes (strain ATCC 55618 / DSM 22257 / CCUG 43843 / 130Z) TaxID=339671 RepID=A6VPB7_ACTSZ|nr:hypothetical protein [Actinobacillus succinogenes]ABR74814.1 hypothetical protein Asuc_1455 [Actinobacillus succinogenes 130Z]PHI40772.1 hypothetical protein CBG46_08850 [Actinobacillus succinogenes]